MKIRTFASTLSALALAVASFTASADILFQNLGTTAPPAVIGAHTMLPFDLSQQTAIPDGANVSNIPGSPIPGMLSISTPATKYPFSALNATWGHGYSGPLFTAPNSATLILPPNTNAFYFYAMGNAYGAATITVTSDSGSSSGAIPVTVNNLGGPDSANGFAFYSNAGETISSVTVNTSVPRGFIFAEFGIASGPVTTCASEGYTGMKLEWCRNVCEKDYTGTQLKIWIRRWMDRYHDLPYCMREDEETPPHEQGAF